MKEENNVNNNNNNNNININININTDNNIGDGGEQKGKISGNRSKIAEHEFRKKVGRQFYVERLMSRMSQSELAEKIGTGKSNISRLENGKENMSVDYVELLAKAFDKDVKLVLSDSQVSYEKTTVYSLKLYDDELVRFRMERSGHGEYGFDVEILEVNDEKRNLFPLDLEVSPDGICRWLTHRSIPANRELVGNILSALNLDRKDLKGLVDVCFALSLNDSYWITPYDFDRPFSFYNLFENEFNRTLSLIAYIGYGSTDKKFMTTPELTTGGVLRKAWRFKGEDGIWLYKSGTDGFANAGNEPFSEFYASQIAEHMGLNAVHYDLERWHHILSSKCRLFTNTDTSYIPIGRIVKTGGIEACINFYKGHGEEFYQQLASMLCFDAIIINEDRHYGNFGVLRDNHTGDIVAPAPIFDNGLSLLCYAMQDDFDNGIEKYIAERSNPYGYGNTFMELARSVMGPAQKEQIRRLINFKFTESDLVNLPTWRLKALEDIIQKRVRELLA